MKVPKEKPFKLESDLCRAFLERLPLDAPRWTAYPETEGWDILLANKDDGTQVGIQAKLALNQKVVSQCLPQWGFSGEVGPDFRAVLVPAGESGHMGDICSHIGITVISQQGPNAPWRSLLDLPRSDYLSPRWHHWLPVRRHTLPDYVPDVIAGDAAPVTLSRWKIQAIKLAILLEERPVTRADLKALGLSPSRWVDRHSGYLIATPQGYVASSYMPDFKKQHPKNFEEIRADREAWSKDIKGAALL